MEGALVLPFRDSQSNPYSVLWEEERLRSARADQRGNQELALSFTHKDQQQPFSQQESLCISPHAVECSVSDVWIPDVLEEYAPIGWERNAHHRINDIDCLLDILQDIPRLPPTPIKPSAEQYEEWRARCKEINDTVTAVWTFPATAVNRVCSRLLGWKGDGLDDQ
ncbi:hypothetical protein BC829DRAFT_413108 [Chytridium lagenaria]|nr:hypothetical protein BC829DRAFT_413108 [Chytridium lagenaria]